MRVGVALSLALAGCWTGKAPPVQTPPPAPAGSSPSTTTEHHGPYRAVTIAADGVGVLGMTVGLIGYYKNADEDLSNVALVTGLIVSFAGAPLMHLGNDQGIRATESIIGRTVIGTVGVAVGIGASDCHSVDCSFEPALLGMVGGFVVSGIADAFLLHGALEKHAVTPTVIPIDSGARIGVLARF